MLVLDNLEGPKDVAVDWVHNNIYVSDLKKQKIIMTNWNGTFTKTISSENDRPRSIALAPLKGQVVFCILSVYKKHIFKVTSTNAMVYREF